MNYKIAETQTFQKEIEKPQYKNVYKKITEYIYPVLRQNPFFGPNIKRLKGNYSDFFRYRVGQYRLFYKVSQETITIFTISIEQRKNAYR